MKFSLSKRLSKVIFFSLLVFCDNAYGRIDQPTAALPVVPVRQLLPDFQNKSDLANLFAFDPNGDLAENPTEVETFLDFNFQSHSSFVLSPKGSLPSTENPKKLILNFSDMAALSGSMENVRTVKFLEIKFSGLSELQQFLNSGSITGTLPNLRYIFLKVPAGTRSEQVGNLLETNPLSDYRVFFSIDSSN
jgi:hypothetical protein